MIVTLNHGPVREVRLNRPPVNALSHDLITALLRAVEVAPEQGADALVLSGPPGLFSAGLDIPLLIKLDRPTSSMWGSETAVPVFNRLAERLFPVLGVRPDSQLSMK